MEHGQPSGWVESCYFRQNKPMALKLGPLGSAIKRKNAVMCAVLLVIISLLTKGESRRCDKSTVLFQAAGRRC